MFSRGEAYAQVKSRIEDYMIKLESNSMLQSLSVSGTGITTLHSMKPSATEVVCPNGTVLGMNTLVADKCRMCLITQTNWDRVRCPGPRTVEVEAESRVVSEKLLGITNSCFES